MMMRNRWFWFMVLGAFMVLAGGLLLPNAAQAQGDPTPSPLYALPDPNQVRVSRSGIIALAGNQRYAVTANTFSGTASIVNIADKRISAEIPVGNDPRALVVAPNQEWMAVTSRAEGTVTLIDLTTFEVIDTIRVGLWPWGVVTNGSQLYIALQGTDSVVQVDIASGAIVREIDVPNDPAGLALWGDFLYVTHFENGALSLVYLPTGRVAASSQGANGSRLTQSLWLNAYDGEIYTPATRANPDNPLLTFDTTVFPVVNVFELDTMNPNRLSRVMLTVADRPVNLPFDVFFDRIRRWLWVVNAGSNDVSVIDVNTGFALANIPVGANPRGITSYADGSFIFVYNALDGTISVIERAFMEEVDTLPSTELDIPIEILIGAQLFYGSVDERVSQDGWLSCATCHFDGADNGQVWVGFPGGEALNTPSLYGVRETMPWGWHGDRDELADFDAFFRIIQHGTGLIEGPINPAMGEPNVGRSPDLDAVVAFLQTIEGPGRNALRIPPEDILAGEAIWMAQGCDACHTPPLYMDGFQHDLGSGPINTPSLRWLWNSAPYYHDGSAATLFEVFLMDEGPHALIGEIPLADINDLIVYLRSLPLE